MISSGTLYTKSAKAWVEAMPLGNGNLGAMVFFGTDSERIALNHDTLWSGTPKKYGNYTKKGAKESYRRAKELALEGKYFEAQEEIENNFLDFRSERYLPLGDLFITFGHSETERYKRSLDFESAAAHLEYGYSGKTYKRRAFVSNPHDVLVYSVKGENKSVSFRLTFHTSLKHNLSKDTNMMIYDGCCPGYSFADAEQDRSDYEYSEGRYKKGVSFRSIVYVNCHGGRCETDEDSIIVHDADSADIFFVTKTNFVSSQVYPELGQKEYKDAAMQTMLQAVKDGCDEVYKKHVADFSSLYGRVKLDLGTSGKDDMPTDERLISFSQTGDDLSLYTLLFDFARYLTISASRKGTRAMNLQGIWNDKDPAPWRSNYTVNINTEMNYWPCLPSGLFECHEPLVSLIKDISKTGRYVARDYYGARGFVAHHNVDLWGHAGAVYQKARWGYWQGGSGWLTRHLFEQYEYTLDKKFLKSTVYPIIKQAALFYIDLMTEAENGQLAIIPGTSPENVFFDENGRTTATAKYSTMMNCIAYETISNAIKCCEILGTDEAFAREAESTLSRIVPLKVGSDGRLMEWNDEFPETEVTHRHVSHLYALHPADMITDKTPELMQAARKTLETRGDDGTGWSLGWKINFHARLGDGNRALKLMERQLAFVPSDIQSVQAHNDVKSGTYANLFDAHPPFQIDGNFGFASGLYEMLARVIGNKLYLLPALPDKWRDGSICGMKIKGGNTLDLIWRDGKLAYYEVKGRTPLKVYYNGKSLTND